MADQDTPDTEDLRPKTAADREEPEAGSVPPPTLAKPGGLGVFVALVAGGAIAAGGGFGLARFGVPNGWPLAATAPLEARLTALETDIATRPDETRISALEAGLAETRASVAGQPNAAADVAIEQSFSGFEGRLSALDVRLAALESVSAGTGETAGAALATYDAAIAELRAELETQKTALAAIPADASAVAAKTAAAEAARAEAEAIKLVTAVGQIQAATESGAPFAAALATLQAAGKDVPAILVESAATGVTTLATLQQAYPAAARAALDASLRANMGATLTDRVASFLRTQTGARSLTPRDGTDPDAILSRVEAALGKGDLTTALTEAKALPAQGVAALAEWQALAERRLAATEAVSALAAALAQQ